MAKTVRFASVVAKSGKPALYLAWRDPEKEPTFARAVKEHRVMTLHQELRGGKKDFGLVGFRREPRAQYLIFPKSLRSFAEARVVAIDYKTFEGELSDAGSLAAQARELSPGATRTRHTGRASPSPPAEVVLFPTAEKSIATPPAFVKENLPKRRRIKMSPLLRVKLSHVLDDLHDGNAPAAERRLREMMGLETEK